MKYNKSDYALNKYSEGIVYPLGAKGTVTVTYADMKRENPGLTAAEFQKLKAFSDEDYRLSCNRDNNYNRKKRPLDALENDKGYFAPTPEDELLLRERETKLRKALREAVISLTETQRRRVRLFCLKKLTEEQIARLEGVSQQNVSKSIILAKEKMKKFFETGV